MKNLVIGGLVLLLGLLGPQQGLESRFEPVWSLGLLMVLAFLCQQIAGHLRLPALAGWIAAGLILGPSGLGVVQPAHFASLGLVHAGAAMWVGALVGTGLFWPRGCGIGRLSAWAGLGTLATFLLTTAAIVAVAQHPWWLAVLFGALASLWGPFTIWNRWQNKNSLFLLGAAGNGFSLVILSAVLILLHQQGRLPDPALHLIGRLGLSLLAGALGAEILWRLGLFKAPAATLFAGVFGSSVLAAVLLVHLQLYALPFGLAAGLVLVGHKSQTRRVQHILQPMRPMALAIFFGLMGATIDLRILWPPLSGFYHILAIQVLVLILLRGLSSVFWLPFPAARRHLGWLLLPKGALLFELIYHPGSGLAGLLNPDSGRLLQQVALGDILVYTLIFPILATAVWHLGQRPELPASDRREKSRAEPAPAT